MADRAVLFFATVGVDSRPPLPRDLGSKLGLPEPADLAPGADAVRIDLFPLSANVGEYPALRQFESTARCVSEDLPALPVGDQEVWVRVGESGELKAFIDFHVAAP